MKGIGAEHTARAGHRRRSPDVEMGMQVGPDTDIQPHWPRFDYTNEQIQRALDRAPAVRRRFIALSAWWASEGVIDASLIRYLLFERRTREAREPDRVTVGWVHEVEGLDEIELGDYRRAFRAMIQRELLGGNDDEDEEENPEPPAATG